MLDIDRVAPDSEFNPEGRLSASLGAFLGLLPLYFPLAVRGTLVTLKEAGGKKRINK